jgi:perosamine synthetase
VKKINTIGKEEEAAVLRVLRSGNLSGYVASSDKGGDEIFKLETEWQRFFETPYAVACNSATSGLLAACMAAGVGPYDEVIVPYYTMSATACAPAVLGATIVLADIDEHFCLDPADVSNLIKAVSATNMFGHPAQLHRLRMICDGAGVVLIEDNAQAIMAKEDGKYTGTIGHMGVFSLNVHKHIQTGEGGLVVTDDPRLHTSLNNAINHGECRRSDYPGLNLRMTEITAAIAREQLKKLPAIVEQRRATAEAIRAGVEIHPDIIEAVPNRSGCEHSYYALPIRVTPTYSTSGVHGALQPSRIPMDIGYDGNLLTKPVSNKWLDQDRMHFLTHAKGYGAIHRLLMVEICSHEITPEQIERLWKNDRRRQAV